MISISREADLVLRRSLVFRHLRHRYLRLRLVWALLAPAARRLVPVAACRPARVHHVAARLQLFPRRLLFL